MRFKLWLSLPIFLANSILLPSANLFAQSKSAKTPEEVPVSLSYSQLTKCFPELKNDAWVRAVNLNELKEEIDRDFLTTQTLLRQREVLMKEPTVAAQTSTTKRLRLAAKPVGGKKQGYNYHLTLESLDTKEIGAAIEIPAKHRTNPEQKVLNGYLVNQDILQDETSYFDTKLKGVTAGYKKNFKDVTEIELKDPAGSRRIFCEQQKDLGVVCTCFSK